jgi:tetratricopeptide (TPR) repeat protein
MCERANVVDLMVKEKARDVVRMARTATQLTLSVVQALSNGLARLPGPKTVVFLSEGFILQDMETELRQAVGQANRAGAHFYTIDARGLNRGSASSAIIDQPAAFDSAGPTNRFDLSSDGTNALAVDTGGMAIRNENNFGRALSLISQDAGTYYVLGYTPTNQAFDGKYRSIAVSVKRDALKVRARRGYLALEPSKLSRPMPSRDTRAGMPSAPPAAAADLLETSAPAPAAGGTGAEPSSAPAVTPSPSGESVAAAAGSSTASQGLRAKIDAGGFVQQLQEHGAAAAAGNDAASRGWAAYQRGNVADAATYLARAAQSPDAHPWVSYALGLSDLALERYAEAIRAWERVRSEAPDYEPVYFNLADGYLLRKDAAAALRVLREAQVRWPKDAEVWNAIGVIQVRRGALDAAIESFEGATTADPADSLGVFNLARSYQLRAAKSQRFDRTMQKWLGGEGDRTNARRLFEKYIQMGGPFVQQAKDALAVLAWQG